MSKCLAIVTEDGLEPTAQTNNTLNAIKLALLQKQAMQGLGFNTREIITESGEWEAPVSGTYKVTLISGGNSGMVYSRSSYGGASGKHITEFVTLVKGQKVSVVIGAGGVFTDNGTNLLGGEGGETSFGELSTININNRLQPMLAIGQTTTAVVTAINGSGFGGGIENKSDQIDGTWYGAGGAAHFDTQSKWAGNGYQGCVIAEYFDPEKASIPSINDTDLIPYLTLLQRLDNLEKQFAENVVYNDEILITESGEWIAPVTGWYEVKVVGGGDGAQAWRIPSNQFINQALGGSGGEIKTVLRFYNKSQQIPVTIGSGGLASVITHNDPNTLTSWFGGNTIFGDITALRGQNKNPTLLTVYNSLGMVCVCSGGMGIDNTAIDGNSTVKSDGSNFHVSANDAVSYGGGGGVFINYGGATNIETATEDKLYWGLGNGKQGCVKVRLHNPNKLTY